MERVIRVAGLPAALCSLVLASLACAGSGGRPPPAAPSPVASTATRTAAAEATEADAREPRATAGSEGASEEASEAIGSTSVAAPSDIDPDSLGAALPPTKPEDPTAEATEREFRAMFGSDPLGLARFPENAERFEAPKEMSSRVQAWIDYFQNRIPERFGLYLNRTGRYESLIRRKLRLAGLPEDLLYLAMIESGMNPNAYSRAPAVGLWQFIRGTARLYDLEISYWVDERRDPVKATDAAIAYLSDLYQEFGSWYLAAAGYNGGAGRVRRSLARTGSSTFWDLARRRALRRETRNYVPKLIAAAIISRDPAKYGFRVQPEPPLEYDEVEVPDATSVDVIAEAAGTDEETIRSLNPEFLHGVTPPGRRVRVRVPPGEGPLFAANYAKIPPAERVTWLVHTVTRGQTLGLIARRYGTSVAALRAANGNLDPRRLQIGQRLVVPRSGRARDRTFAVAGRDHSRPTTPVTVIVRRGDTLWAIARRYAVSTSQLMEWNHLRSSHIKPGDRLRIQPARTR
ncbi:MAG: LysM peptidoglycan-binding domain-containing protein [Gemmatimonadota bacterium]